MYLQNNTKTLTLTKDIILHTIIENKSKDGE